MRSIVFLSLIGCAHHAQSTTNYTEDPTAEVLATLTPEQRAMIPAGPPSVFPDALVFNGSTFTGEYAKIKAHQADGGSTYLRVVQEMKVEGRVIFGGEMIQECVSDAADAECITLRKGEVVILRDEPLSTSQGAGQVTMDIGGHSYGMLNATELVVSDLATRAVLVKTGAMTTPGQCDNFQWTVVNDPTVNLLKTKVYSALADENGYVTYQSAHSWSDVLYDYQRSLNGCPGVDRPGLTKEAEAILAMIVGDAVVASPI